MKEYPPLYFKRLSCLLLEGWEVETASLYDEEGVDGWRWFDPSHEEYYEIGIHEEMPVIPKELEAIADEFILKRNI